jgi:hypothetical protein
MKKQLTTNFKKKFAFGKKNVFLRQNKNHHHGLYHKYSEK